MLGGVNVSAEAGRGTRMDLWESTFRELNNANVAVYPVDARGLVAIISNAPQAMYSGTGLGGNTAALIAGLHAQNNDTLETMTWIAKETGGKALVNSNDIVNAVDAASSESSATYIGSSHG